MDIERYLPMVEKAAAKGTIEMADDASAFDRMRMHDKLPQHYGSHTGVKTICVKSRKREKQSNRLCCNKLQDIPLI